MYVLTSQRDLSPSLETCWFWNQSIYRLSGEVSLHASPFEHYGSCTLNVMLLVDISYVLSVESVLLSAPLSAVMFCIIIFKIKFESHLY